MSASDSNELRLFRCSHRPSLNYPWRVLIRVDTPIGFDYIQWGEWYAVQRHAVSVALASGKVVCGIVRYSPNARLIVKEQHHV